MEGRVSHLKKSPLLALAVQTSSLRGNPRPGNEQAGPVQLDGWLPSFNLLRASWSVFIQLNRPSLLVTWLRIAAE